MGDYIPGGGTGPNLAVFGVFLGAPHGSRPWEVLGFLRRAGFIVPIAPTKTRTVGGKTDPPQRIDK